MVRSLDLAATVSKIAAPAHMTESSSRQVGPDTVVEFTYDLYDAEGELVESGAEDAAVSLLWGYGQAVPSLEAALAGLVAGQRKRISLRAEEAFGARDEQAIIAVDRDEVPATVAVGDELEAESERGGVVSLRVLEVTEDAVILDTNHPLAGQQISLEVSVVGVRVATQDEISVAAADLLSRQTTQGDVLLPAARLLRRPPSASKTPDPS